MFTLCIIAVTLNQEAKTMADLGPKAIEVGDSVHTPDGEGKIKAISDRYVTVDHGDHVSMFSPREIFLDAKLEIPAPNAPPAPQVEPAPEPVAEEPAAVAPSEVPA